MLNFRAVAAVGFSRLLEFSREPTAVFWVFGFPFIILIVLGSTFTDRPPEKLHVNLIDGSDSELGKQLWRNLSGDERIVVSAPQNDPEKQLRRVGLSLIIRVVADQAQVGATQFELTFDPDRLDSTHARAIAEMHIARLGGEAPPVKLISSASQGSRYVDFLVPGLLAVGAMGASLVWFGYGLAELRMLKLLRVLMATPLSKLELLLGLLFARWILLIPEAWLVLTFSSVLFGVNCLGSVTTLMVVLLLGTTTFAAIGFLIGSRGNRLEAASGWVSVLMLAQWVFCGVFFSRSVFPASWQPLIAWLPLSPFVDATRAVMLDGAGLFDLGIPLVVLAGWTIACTVVGMLLFRAD